MGELYDQDFIGWTEQQAALLRKAAHEGSNLGLDWANLIEEVEGLGRSEYHALSSQVRRILVHLLKLEYSPSANPRSGWRDSIADARSEVEGLLERDPGLRPRLPGVITSEAPRAIRQVIATLRAYGEDPTDLIARQKAGTDYSMDQILGDWLPELPEKP